MYCKIVEELNPVTNMPNFENFREILTFQMIEMIATNQITNDPNQMYASNAWDYFKIII